MNKNIEATNDELQKNVGKYVAVKMTNGRVISGRIQFKDDQFWLKLGVQWLPFENFNIKHITLI